MDNTVKKYSTIDLPLRVFLDALIDKDYSQVEDFESIYLEHSITIGGNDLANKISRRYDYEKLKLKVLTAEICFQTLELQPINEEAIRKQAKSFEVLKSLGYHNKLPSVEMDDHVKYCQQIKGWYNFDKVKLKEYENENNGSKKQSQTEPTRNDYIKSLIEISSCFKVPLNDMISVREYDMWVLKHREYAEHMINQQNKHQYA